MARNEKLAILNNKIPERFTTKEELKMYVDKMKERDETPVTGTFRNIEKPGEGIKFDLRMWGKHISHWEFEDNEVRTIPYGVAIHINNGCNRIAYTRVKNPAGDKPMMAGVKTSRSNGRKDMDVAHHIARFAFICPDIPTRSELILSARVI